ncbi:hypothetical protein D9757_009938 [Collybiopsis confluens]|uniref:Uncharacterized protein n=1 Tax=Collybiopsis confluens TaxID=2823264 RepID=A0A8H5LZV3_9AGAR|nr:hypothetical protein D9757_009938 [Collybiopsis confluens]
METRFIASGLLVTGVDAFVTRKGESEYVWTGPFKLTRVRFLYILARYLALVIHVTDISFSIIMVAKFSRAKLVPESFCMSMLVFQSVSSQSMLLVLHSILMLRVFALYNRSVILGALLSFLLIAKFAGVTSMVLHGLITSPRVLRFSGPCLNEMAWTHGHPFENPFVIFIFGELVTQVILHGLAWKRTFWDFRLVSSSRPPLLSVLNRDGFTVFMGIAVAMIAMSVSAVKKGMGVVFVFPTSTQNTKETPHYLLQFNRYIIPLVSLKLTEPDGTICTLMRMVDCLPPSPGALLSSRQNRVELPAELEREIFEVAARAVPGTAVKLAGLCKRSQYWMEWLIYETVVLDYPPARTAAFLRTLVAKPTKFFAERVKNLQLSYSVTLNEAQKILDVCTGLTQLVCWAESCHVHGWLRTYFTPSYISDLTRLSLKLEMLTEAEKIPTFSDEIFQRLTHLEIVLPPPLHIGRLIDWTGLVSLPNLKHLTVGDVFSWDHLYLLPVLRDLLDHSLTLETLVVITKEPQMLEALNVENYDDPRLVIFPRFNWPMDLPTYWQKMYTGQLDSWDLSIEKVKEQRKERNKKEKLLKASEQAS